MRRLIFLTVLVLFASLQGCKKEGNLNLVEATVVIDCTGLYLKVDGLDYKVCNEETLANYSSGDKVKATFVKIKDCTARAIICDLYHPYESWINVMKVE
ncbi:MAG: hypothetical protein J5I50_11965 [Chitinophagaceae bacterium]|nr:hypothetical protein [Chitinophagaceae bacterium]